MKDAPELDPTVASGIDRLLSVQRPVVLAHIRSIRARHPEASPDRIIAILEKRFLAAVTAGGAAVGASAVIPGVGTGVSLALTGVETAGFLEASALFAQSVTEVHGITVEDPARARALVMTMMLGAPGAQVIQQFTGQFQGQPVDRNANWGRAITSGLPSFAIGPIADRIKRAFIKRFVVNQSASAIGRAVPFGIGAVIGGAGNRMLGNKIVASSRQAFGPAPAGFPTELGVPERKPRVIRVAEKKAAKG